MRTVNFRDGVLYPVAHLLGVDPTLDLNKDHARAWTSFINSRVNEAWASWEWEDLKITEERAYRTIWNAGRNVKQGDEVLYLPEFKYYLCILTPPVGTLPTDPAYYEPTTLTDYYVSLDQVGRRPIDEVFGAFASNPRTAGAITKPLFFKPSEKGIDIDPTGSNGISVWVNYRLQPSVFTVTPYDPTNTYQPGDTMYWSDGNSWQAIATTLGNDPSVPGYWRVVKMPSILAEFVKYAVAADACDDINSVQLWRGYAEDALYSQINALGEQGQVYHYRRPRRYGYWSYGPWGYPFVTNGSGTSLGDQDDEFIPEVGPPKYIMEAGITPLVVGQAYVDVVFLSAKTSTNYHFDELVVEYTGPGPMLLIRPEMVVGMTTTGFRVLLNGAPLTPDYNLRWRVTS